LISILLLVLLVDFSWVGIKRRFKKSSWKTSDSYTSSPHD